MTIPPDDFSLLSRTKSLLAEDMTHHIPGTVLITGVSGFLGRHIVKCFGGQEWRVVGIDAVSPKTPIEGVGTFHGLTLPSPETEKIIRACRPKFCIHCAGLASVGLSMKHPESDFEAGPVLVFHVLNAIRRTALDCRFVFLSSASVYGNPTLLPVDEHQPPRPISPYGFHKWQSELACCEFSAVYGVRTAAARIFSAYGPGLRQQVIWDLCRKIIRGEPFTVQGTGAESRDFIYAEDIAQAIKQICLAAPMQGEVYNVANGREVMIRTLVEQLVDILKVTRAPQFDGHVPAGNPLRWMADTTRIRALGFQPRVPFDQGLQMVARWCLSESKREGTGV